jgi:gas vesicle protein
MSRKNLTYLGLALAGGAVGAVIGLLAAPYSGRETRKRLARSIGDRKDEILRAGYQAADSVSEFVRAS